MEHTGNCRLLVASIDELRQVSGNSSGSSTILCIPVNHSDTLTALYQTSGYQGEAASLVTVPTSSSSAKVLAHQLSVVY
ncbi:Hypothetical predicted protein [Octopus vulgaris]|uniref:Uncharacterized protein n=1 Tax=Octopus vulgaris TaxID=6645 RepID=A0AA36B270_OCTVU|nr:Hypothetical predicted protein [Octopus vulgaris]